MARVPTKKTKAKPAAEISPAVEPPAPETSANATAVEENAVSPEQSGSGGLRPPSTPVEPTNDGDTKVEERRGYQRDKIAASINIAKRQAMSMTDLNNMAGMNSAWKNTRCASTRSSFPNALQKKTPSARGFCFRKAFLEIFAGSASAFCARRVSITSPAPKTFTFSPSQIRRFDLQTGNLIVGKSVRRRKRKNFFALLKVEAVDGEEPM